MKVYLSLRNFGPSVFCAKPPSAPDVQKLMRVCGLEMSVRELYRPDDKPQFMEVIAPRRLPHDGYLELVSKKSRITNKYLQHSDSDGMTTSPPPPNPRGGLSGLKLFGARGSRGSTPLLYRQKYDLKVAD